MQVILQKMKKTELLSEFALYDDIYVKDIIKSTDGSKLIYISWYSNEHSEKIINDLFDVEYSKYRIR